ncbi:MAG TPA: energy-coupling factor transporter transmembrane component T [Bryobacteraceae bacterium]|nr:energy-coupling factor transporter transmembrane component T [Bryobacteraceae bacterium]
MHRLAPERWARGSSPLHRRDPRAKVVALLVFLIALATAHRGLPQFALGLFVLLVAALLWARVPVWGALVRAGIVLPFSAVFAVVSWMAGDAARGVPLAIKSYLSALAVLLLISTTPLPILLRGLESMGAPHFLLDVGQFLYRYFFVISDEAQRMNGAAAARGASARQWRLGGQRFQAAAGALAVLFARSYARAEDIHRAMLARGFEGRFLALSGVRFQRIDLLFTAVASLAPLALRIAVERALA